jgi:methylated-DNA-protein-cysteine methyltransferase-like protein
LHSGVNGARRQAETLRLEGVVVEENAMGEYSVSLAEYGWFPDELSPDNEEEEQDKDEEGEEDDE